MATRPDLLAVSPAGAASGRAWWLVGLLIALALVLLAPLASSSPDGLERVADDKGFIEVAEGARFEIIAGYLFPGVENEVVATVLAGLLGTVIVFGVAFGLAHLIASVRRSRRVTSS
jgi:hypothetical protein